MKATLDISLKRDAAPLAQTFARKLRLALSRRKNRLLIFGLRGTFAIKSVKGKQAASLTFSAGRIDLCDGVSDQARVTIETDFDKPDTQPNIIGFFRHPLAAWRFARLIRLPLPDWTESAENFWTLARGSENLPDQLIITNQDENRSLSFGEGTETAEILGSSRRLEALLIGQTTLADDVSRGKMRFRGSMQHMAGISNVCQQLLLGDLDG